MTPRIPKGWVVATERGEGVQLWHSNCGRYFPSSDHVWSGTIVSSPWTYIRRTDPSVPADPNEALRLEDEAARLDERKPDHIPDAGPMVTGMVWLTSGVYLPLAGLTWGRVGDGSGTWVAPAEWEHETTPLHDDRPSAEFAAAYTAAWECTERRRAEIAEEVRRGGAPTAEPDLDEWPGRPEVPPDSERNVEILTPHGACPAWFMGDCRLWVVRLENYRDGAEVDPVDVLAWREEPRPILDANGRVTGVTRG